MPSITAPAPHLGGSKFFTELAGTEPSLDVELGWEVIVVGTNGSVLAPLPNVSVEEMSWVLNDFGTMSFSFPSTLPYLDALNGIAASEMDYVWIRSEVQVRYAGKIRWWGVVVRIEDDMTTVKVQCADLLWYFKRRFVGKASRTNLLSNPSFELGDTGAWAANGVAYTFSTLRSKLEAISLRLTQANALTDTYMYQDVLNYQATGVGTLLTVVAWFYIENDGSWVGEAIGKRGLTLSRFQPSSGPLISSVVYEIDGDTPRGSWQRALAGGPNSSDPEDAWMPPNAIEDLEVRLYAPGGIINWDACQVVIMESLSSVSSATDFTSDQATIMKNLVLHAQDPVVNKDDLSIAATDASCPPTGVRRERHYQYAEHAEILAALQEFPTLERGCDFRIEITDTTRTFTTGFPHIGIDRTKTHICYAGPNGNVSGLRFSIDGEQFSTSVTTLGKGSGPDREEGGAIAGVGISGPVLETVIAEPTDSDIDYLQEFAQQQLDTGLHPIIIDVTVQEPSWIGEVLPGDTVTLMIDVPVDMDSSVNYTSYNYSGTHMFRVIHAVASAHDNSLTLTLNNIQT